MRKITKRAAIIATAGIIAIGSAGAAFAYWASSGTGDAEATAGTAGAVTATAVVDDTLHPGAIKSLKVTFTNSNDYPVEIGQISGGTVAVVDGGACTVANAGVTVKAPLSTGTLLIPASSDPKRVETIAGAVSMSASSHTACQGKTFTFSLTLAAPAAAAAPAAPAGS